MFNYQDNQRPVQLPSRRFFEEHVGFCLGPYNSETCNICYCESDCLELRNKEILEYLLEPYV
jgi:hypothetical protein